MEVQILQIPVFDYDAKGYEIEVNGYFVLHKLVAITPSHRGGSNICFEGEHAWETPLSPKQIVDTIYTALNQLYGGEYKQVKTEIKEEE